MLPAVLSLRPKVRPPGEPFSWRGLTTALSEVSGPAALTASMFLVREAQQHGEPVAWISRPDSIFFPPDVEASGVDLSALVVVRVPGDAAARAGELLVRSSGFGLVVIDLEKGQRVPTPMLSRLLGLAQKHEAAVLFLTVKGERDGSLDSLISMRAWAAASRTSEGLFTLTVRAVKDKRHAPSWERAEVCRGPAGLR